ncbi:hypothetical protein EYR40_002936 [Pleurotus pulmonarius]|nr:hypothetical protein EYR40_002936 [Pleurotus pulmonarius]
MSAPVALATQTFFAWRIAKVSARLWLGIPFALLALLQCFASLYWSIGTLAHGRTVDQFQSYARIVDLELVTSVVCNLLITVAMSTMTLIMPTTPYRVTYNQIAQLSVETNLFLTIGSIIELILWRTMPHNGFHFMLFLLMSRLYATILVASLNSRIHYSTSQSSSFESRNGATLWADMSRREMDINTMRSGIMTVQANAIINRESEYGFQPSRQLSCPSSPRNCDNEFFPSFDPTEFFETTFFSYQTVELVSHQSNDPDPDFPAFDWAETSTTFNQQWLNRGDHRHSGQLSRSMSLSSRAVLKGDIKRVSGRNGSEVDEAIENQKRIPLTPVERHAELLHVIAQKESICLELRSQLEAHEAELLQLKRKWEIVVSRGLDIPTPLSLDRIPPTPHAPDKGSAIVLEGIKEGVQGVGRLILGQPVTTSAKSRARGDRHRTMTTPHLSQSSDISISSNTSSWSSVTTTSTKRTSVSSSGSAGADKEVVQDTGVTPIISPTPPFSPLLHQIEAPAGTTDIRREESPLTSSSPRINNKTLRRRSAGAGLSPSLPSRLDDDHSVFSATYHPIEPMKLSKNPSLPPPASIPGLGTFSAGVGMDTTGLGKRWEDGLIKSQRRASTFLSDLVSAFSPPTSSPLPHSSPSASPPTSSTPLRRSRTVLSPLAKSPPASRSLLDDSDDDNTIGGLMSTDIMIPDKSRTYPAKKTPLRRSSSQKASKPSSMLPDDEWNW